MKLKKAGKPVELDYSDLKWSCDPGTFKFESTRTLKPIEGIIGQERAIKALKIGVDLHAQGYNIFVTGLSGTGKFSTIKKMLESIRPNCSELLDYAYVNNFKDTDRPILLSFPAGTAVKFKKELASAIKFFQEKIPQLLDTEPFVTTKKNLYSEYGIAQQEALKGFEKKLKKDHFTLGQVKVGELARPEIFALIGDESVMVSQLGEYISDGKITDSQAKQITSKYSGYQEELQRVFKASLKLSQEFQEKMLAIERETTKDIVEITIGDLKTKFNFPKVIEYLNLAQDNILDTLDIFKGQKPAREETEGGIIVDYLKEYEVNIMLDNEHIKECPVIIETSPTYSNLFGTIEKYSDGSGGWYADFTRIKSGSLLRANGGYLVINALDAYTEPGVWKSLKRVLLYNKLEIQDVANLYMFSPSIIKPEPIEISTKIILIGNDYIYGILSNYEDDFNKIFKIKAAFDYEMKRTDQALLEYAGVIKKLIESDKLLEFDASAIAKIAEYGARYAGEKNKLTTRFAYISDIALEANFWALDSGDSVVTSYQVQQAFNSSRERHSLYESKVSEMISNGTILIDTEGEKIGTINGLAVYGDNLFSFGKPTRITASVSLGSGSIINVEREAGLSGNTHNKGMLIITGYFREKFGRRFPLSFQASVVFEQGYGMIDGDSASITEICALLSAISRIPIKQSLAITGSVNQRGNIQPIGGINEKIEGFFDVCKEKGLSGIQGVVMPALNVKDLMLKDEVIEAVKKKKFHIYPVEKVEEAVEILMGFKAGSELKSGAYETDSIFGVVEKTLDDMHKKIKGSTRKENNKPDNGEEKKPAELKKKKTAAKKKNAAKKKK
jgi:lon-related putative ATP-dependent protease